MAVNTAETCRRALIKYSWYFNDFCCVINVNTYTSTLKHNGMANIKFIWKNFTP